MAGPTPHSGAWPKSPSELVSRFEEGTAWLLDEPGVARRQMFGYPACFVNGNMFTSLHEDRWVVRLGDSDRAELEGMGGGPFEVMPGRQMKGYVVLPADLAQPDAARPWLERALALGRSLPAKKR
jgi:TfoX/Sxy family transcriptional regulator of competence genes